MHDEEEHKERTAEPTPDIGDHLEASTASPERGRHQ